ncbi:DUF3179 domain-containing protein [Rubrimonas sp.]|uniref:DUF3179 domain-containing protein n=1 Tax=Rubrimonas sp. TaxID=2036015 RepID=UPI002FDD796C
MRPLRAPEIAVALALAAGAALADPAQWAREWPRTDFDRMLVDPAEIFSGGPPKDGIPAIDDPRFVSVSEAAANHAAVEPVMSLAIDGDARAYPLRILTWHEIVNDTVAGAPVAVTFCPLCNSAVAFERVVDGAETTFGVSGKLRHSDMLMYDRATESWWQQFEGRAVAGVRAGDVLDRLPSRLESFADFAERHPEGRVLVPTDPGLRAYGRNPYVGYDGAPRPFLYRGDYDGPGRALMRVVSVPGREEAWSFEHLRAAGEVVADDLVIRWRPGQASALDAARIAEGRDVGTVTVQRRRSDGTLDDVPYDVPFAFAFRAFHPGAPIRHVD